jgi:hypothetical protein
VFVGGTREDYFAGTFGALTRDVKRSLKEVRTLPAVCCRGSTSGSKALVHTSINQRMKPSRTQTSCNDNRALATTIQRWFYGKGVQEERDQGAEGREIIMIIQKG